MPSRLPVPGRCGCRAATLTTYDPLPEDGRVRAGELPAIETVACTVHHGSFTTWARRTPRSWPGSKHVGPFAEVGPTIGRIIQFIEERGGKHHEIYLNDFRRTAPEKLKTVIRHPFE